MAEYMGEYKIIRRMDGGGNANVFVAENARGEEVAIKILREESGNGKKAVKRTKRKPFCIRPPRPTIASCTICGSSTRRKKEEQHDNGCDP
mgnify:CR=1 FL=1